MFPLSLIQEVVQMLTLGFEREATEDDNTIPPLDRGERHWPNSQNFIQMTIVPSYSV